jgi:hypothetical protein
VPTSESDQLDGSAVIVKVELDAGWLLTVTENGSEVEPAGTTATMLLSLQLITVQFVPLSVTVLLPWVAPKLAPEIITFVPIGPDVGDIPAIVGACA